MSVKWIGMDQLQARLEKAASMATARRVAGVLYREGESVMTDSKANYVPVWEGVLRGSGFVEPPVVTETKVSVTLGYGGAASAYALVQHERLDFRHTVGGAKYLERPVYAASERIRRAVGEAVEL